MQSGKQIAIIAGCAALAALLYFAPRKQSDNAEHKKENVLSGFNFESFIAAEKQHLNQDQLSRVEGLESEIKKNNTNDSLFIQLASVYDSAKVPVAAGYYYEQLATRSSSEKAWLGAAFRYFDGFKTAADSALHAEMLAKAIATYKKVLEINPKNLDAKTDLGVCYTETPQPMQGIQLLRDVVAENPKHEQAQMNLGILSVRSRQYDKAVDRFNKVLEINPARTSMHVFIGECYAEQGNLQKAKEEFIAYKKTGNDPALLKQVNMYLEEINNNIKK